MDCLLAYTLILSVLGILQMYWAGEGKRYAWALLFINQMLWLPFIYWTESWGLLPINFAYQWLAYKNWNQRRNAGTPEYLKPPSITEPRMKLFHATTQKKAKAYKQTGHIIAPVRGFTTQMAAMAWAMKVGRTVILEIECPNPYKLPDHHNEYGEAWWNDGDVKDWKCVFSANGDA